jgi:hypothetical protein
MTARLVDIRVQTSEEASRGVAASMDVSLKHTEDAAIVFPSFESTHSGLLPYRPQSIMYAICSGRALVEVVPRAGELEFGDAHVLLDEDVVHGDIGALGPAGELGQADLRARGHDLEAHAHHFSGMTFGRGRIARHMQKVAVRCTRYGFAQYVRPRRAMRVSCVTHGNVLHCV